MFQQDPYSNQNEDNTSREYSIALQPATATAAD